jgi:phage shock protein E
MMNQSFRFLIATLLFAATGSLSALDDKKITAETKIEHVDAAGAAKLLAGEQKPVVLDVRTPAEHAAGRIAGSKLIDFRAADFAAKVAELDRSQTYLVHCQAGGRSTNSLEVFKKLGFKHILHLDNGFGGWEDAGQPVVKGE